jgi:hypothetical protein
MFGGLSYRPQFQIQRFLDIDLSVVYFPDHFIIIEPDDSTETSQDMIIRQASALDLGKLADVDKRFAGR